MAEGTDRGVSETMGVAVLVVLTVGATLAVGMTVVLTADDGDPEASFDFEQLGDRLLVTHDGGDSLAAGDLLIRGPDSSVTWAENAATSAGTEIGPGDATQIGPGSPYGVAVETEDFVEVVYVPEDGEEIVLDERGEPADPLG